MVSSKNENKDGLYFKMDRSCGKSSASAQTVSWAHMADKIDIFFFIFIHKTVGSGGTTPIRAPLDEECLEKEGNPAIMLSCRDRSFQVLYTGGCVEAEKIPNSCLPYFLEKVNE